MFHSFLGFDESFGRKETAFPLFLKFIITAAATVFFFFRITPSLSDIRAFHLALEWRRRDQKDLCWRQQLRESWHAHVPVLSPDIKWMRAKLLLFWPGLPQKALTDLRTLYKSSHSCWGTTKPNQSQPVNWPTFKEKKHLDFPNGLVSWNLKQPDVTSQLLFCPVFVSEPYRNVTLKELIHFSPWFCFLQLFLTLVMPSMAQLNIILILIYGLMCSLILEL